MEVNNTKQVHYYFVNNLHNSPRCILNLLHSFQLLFIAKLTILPDKMVFLSYFFFWFHYFYLLSLILTIDIFQHNTYKMMSRVRNFKKQGAKIMITSIIKIGESSCRKVMKWLFPGI